MCVSAVHADRFRAFLRRTCIRSHTELLFCFLASFCFSLLQPALMNDRRFGARLFPFTAERQRDGNGRKRVGGGVGGSDMRNLVSVGKNLLSWHMDLAEVDKYSDSKRATTKMMDESRLTESYKGE